MKKFLSAWLFMLSFIGFSQENSTSHSDDLWTSSRPDGHAPIGVMGDHYHHKGEFMFSYRFMTMQMKDLRYQDEDVSKDFVYNNYMVTPQKMLMNMHMLGAMYAPSDKLTLMAMGNYISNDMDLQMQMTNNMGMNMRSDFTTNSNGFGDVSLSALYRIFNKNQHSLHTQVGVILPTGSIEKKDETAMSNENKVILPYPMQIGSGSFSTQLGLTYLWQKEMISGGIQGKTMLRLNDNKNDYRLGNQYNATSWLALKASEYLSFSVRGEVSYTDDISGRNEVLNPMMVTTVNPKNYGGFIANYAIGVNFLIPQNALKNLRFAAEIILPAYQEPNGIQLKQNYTLTFGTQYSF
ncbi:transporter [Mesonia maritima]|uniref:Transporter n=1 Tax=Mesonia maritima TaxID=1793873 RepID=A0ABU1K1E0_9FLAO|nr:transporter [Mesonia maritima]MDR6299438.1 hypothetical protein [Mesonia maritima]